MTTDAQLKALAEAAKGWTLNFVMNMTDEEPCEVGWKDEDGCFYPVITVDCENYFKPSEPLANYITAANPERILALIAENERYREALKQMVKAYIRLLEAGRDVILQHGGQCDSVEKMEASDPNLRDARKALGETK